MKKGQIFEGKVREVAFPNKGLVETEGQERDVTVKNVLEGQKIRFSVSRAKQGKCEGRLLEVLERAPGEVAPVCPHFADCGGCTYQNLEYGAQLDMKARQVRKILGTAVRDRYAFEGIRPSPVTWAYRNKMEYSFGDEVKDGPLALGMHRRGSFYDIVNVPYCRIADGDFGRISGCVLEYCQEAGMGFYHRMQHTGYLRHLLVRKGGMTGEILVDIVTTTQEDHSMEALADRLRALPLEGRITGILHTFNDTLADVIRNDETRIIYGKDYFYEELLGLKFKITPFSFFQTNSRGAETLYELVRSYVGETRDKVIFDLYSGTGTIAQMLAPVARKVIGIEIVPEAVEAARQNAERNGLTNCEFIAGDVLSALDAAGDEPDFIVLDPPRDGINPKALRKIIAFGVAQMVYISCKPTSLARDLVQLQAGGYRVERVCCVDMFPGTVHVETCALLTKSSEA